MIITIFDKKIYNIMAFGKESYNQIKIISVLCVTRNEMQGILNVFNKS